MSKYTRLTFFHGNKEEINIMPKIFVYEKIIKSLKVEKNYFVFKGFYIELVENIRDPTKENIELFKKYMEACKEVDPNFFILKYKVWNNETEEEFYFDKLELEKWINEKLGID